MIELNLDSCTKDANTCPVVVKLFEVDAFEVVIQPLDPEAAARRDMLGDFVTACARGTCPGQDPELARRLIAKRQQGNE